MPCGRGWHAAGRSQWFVALHGRSTCSDRSVAEAGLGTTGRGQLLVKKMRYMEVS